MLTIERSISDLNKAVQQYGKQISDLLAQKNEIQNLPETTDPEEIQKQIDEAPARAAKLQAIDQNLEVLRRKHGEAFAKLKGAELEQARLSDESRLDGAIAEVKQRAERINELAGKIEEEIRAINRLNDSKRGLWIRSNSSIGRVETRQVPEAKIYDSGVVVGNRSIQL